jgi:transmembrane sensor
MAGEYYFNEERFWQLLSRKLTSGASVAESMEFENLLLAYPEWRIHAEMFEQMWQQEKAETGNAENIDAAYVKHLLKYKSELLSQDYRFPGIVTDVTNSFELETSAQPLYNKIKRIKKILVPAVLILVTASFFVFKTSPAKKAKLAENAKPLSSVSTKNGNRTKLTLPDGTQVWLNAGSRIEYNDAVFNKTQREVTLTGEAFFDVTKNPQKPFIVHSGNMQLKVLGTAFNVKAYPGEKNMETSLLRGLVEVTLNNRPDEKIFLHPNEKIIVANSAFQKTTNSVAPAEADKILNQPLVSVEKINYLPKDSLIAETSWLYDKLVFRSQSFEDLAKQMERKYDVSIHFSDDKLKSLVFTGIFSTETIEQALDALEYTTQFHYTIKNNIIEINP